MMLRRGRSSGSPHRHGRFRWWGLSAPWEYHAVAMIGRISSSSSSSSNGRVCVNVCVRARVLCAVLCLHAPSIPFPLERLWQAKPSQNGVSQRNAQSPGMTAVRPALGRRAGGNTTGLSGAELVKQDGREGGSGGTWGWGQTRWGSRGHGCIGGHRARERGYIGVTPAVSTALRPEHWSGIWRWYRSWHF